MHETQDVDVHSKFKLAQLWKVVQNTNRHEGANDSRMAVINKILKGELNINYRVTIRFCDSIMPPIYSDLEDCTALHFVYYMRDIRDIDAFNALLERGADFTARNAKGNTLLHLVLSNQYIKYSLPFIESVLSAHVKHQNVANPQNDKGLSHLHAACIANHVDSLKLFLDADATSINQTTNHDCEFYPSFSPLDFVALNDSFEAAQILVKRGADVNAKNASGMTLLDACLKRRLKLFRQVNYKNLSKKDKENYQYSLCQNEKLIKLFLDCECVSAVGLSKLHIASTLKDLSILEKLLSQEDVDIDYAVPTESSIYPGYTAAHFAALNSIDAVKILFRRGAKIEAINAEGTSALCICLRDYKIKEVHDMLASAENWKSLRFSDGRTSFLDCLLPVTASVDQFKLFLQNVTENTITLSDSFVWQGCTMLHLAVILANNINDDVEFQGVDDKSIVEECLKFGQSINTQNSLGESAIHLAFRLNKKNILQLLLERLDSQDEVENLVDRDNLSYLHIACRKKNVSLVEKLLRTSNPNVVYKGKNFSPNILTDATPLHLTATNGSFALTEKLLRHGADLHATDINNRTPIHCLMKNYTTADDRQNADVFFRYLLDDPKDCVSDVTGLNYLHVACFFGNVQAARKLIELGSNVNAAVSSEEQMCKAGLVYLKEYSTYTPLLLTEVSPTDELIVQLAQASPTDELIDLLIVRGADVFAKSTNSHIHQKSASFIRPLDDKNILHRFMSILWDREDMQKLWEKKLGLTRLHIACCLKNEGFVKSVLNSGEFDINAQMNKDSEIFAGCTPLHLLLTHPYRILLTKPHVRGGTPRELGPFTVSPTVQLLLDHGADVTIVDAENNSPVHQLQKHKPSFIDWEQCEALLWNAHRDFNINPAGEDGMSHFHLACYWYQVDVVEKFLKQGSVDVNRPTEFFAYTNAGATPLHLALLSSIYQEFQDPDWPRVSQTVDLLLKHGADVAAKDVFGDTPLHKPAPMRSPQLSIFNKLVSYGADINAENLKGQTPLDEIISRRYNNNTNNDFISLFKKYNYRLNTWNHTTEEGNIGRMLASPNRNITERPEFKELLQSSDVREVDEMGRTVIHNAVASVKNDEGYLNNNVTSGIEKLFALGIDVDRQDVTGQTALHYAARMENKTGVTALLECGADVNIIDHANFSAFSYAFVQGKARISEWVELELVVMILHLHVQKLLQLGLEVNELNKKLSESTKQFFDEMDPAMGRRYVIQWSIEESFFSQVELSKTVDVGAALLVLFDFLSETNAVTRYPYLLASNRNIIDDFFKNFNEKEFDQLGGIVKLQYRKMKARLEMMDEALTALQTLLGFSLAGLCEEITMYLPNSDLRNLIASSTI